MRPSWVGPRPEKLMMSLALSDPPLVTPQPSVPEARTLSAAPTVITFLAVPGAVTLP
jgi:hypothetical protein